MPEHYAHNCRSGNALRGETKMAETAGVRFRDDAVRLRLWISAVPRNNCTAAKRDDDLPSGCPSPAVTSAQPRRALVSIAENKAHRISPV
jgi:hypothetical protein